MTRLYCRNGPTQHVDLGCTLYNKQKNLPWKCNFESKKRRTNSPKSQDRVIDQAELRALLSSLSHELCRPLVSLRAGFDLLLGDAHASVTVEQRGHLLTMVSLCDDLLRLTRGYLDYAGLVNGARQPSFGSFSLGAIIREIDRQFRSSAVAKGLSWEVVGPELDVRGRHGCLPLSANLWQPRDQCNQVYSRSRECTG